MSNIFKYFETTLIPFKHHFQTELLSKIHFVENLENKNKKFNETNKILKQNE